MMGWPVMTAAGRLMSVMAAKAYAAHIVPTDVVMASPILLLNRAMALSL